MVDLLLNDLLLHHQNKGSKKGTKTRKSWSVQKNSLLTNFIRKRSEEKIVLENHTKLLGIYHRFYPRQLARRYLYRAVCKTRLERFWHSSLRKRKHILEVDQVTEAVNQSAASTSQVKKVFDIITKDNKKSPSDHIQRNKNDLQDAKGYRWVQKGLLWNP